MPKTKKKPTMVDVRKDDLVKMIKPDKSERLVYVEDVKHREEELNWKLVKSEKPKPQE